MLDDLAGKPSDLTVFDNKCLYIIVLTISGPNYQDISVPVAYPSLGTIEFVLSGVYFISTCFKVGCIRTYLVFSQPPSTNQLEIFQFR